MLSKSLGTFVRLLINIAKLPSRKAFPSHAIFVGCLMRLVWILHLIPEEEIHESQEIIPGSCSNIPP